MLNLVDTDFGYFLCVDNETISSYVQKNEFWDPILRPYFDTHSNLEKIAIDCGANMGFYSVYLAKLNKCVYAIEAQKWVFWHLCANLFLNNSFNVDAYNLAVSSENDYLYMASDLDMNMGIPRDRNGIPKYFEVPQLYSGIGFSTNKGDYKVKSIKLDDLLTEQEKKCVGIIKLDIQGGEYRALNGMVDIIEQSRPVIIFEFEPLVCENYGASWDDYVNFFKNVNYSINLIRDGQGSLASDFICLPN